MNEDIVTRLEWLATQLDAPNSCGGALVREAIALIRKDQWVNMLCGDHEVNFLAPECPECRKEYVNNLDTEGFHVFEPES